MGSSNTRIKLHLGLKIPRQQAAHCVEEQGAEYCHADETLQLRQLPSTFWAWPSLYADMNTAAWTTAVDASCRGRCAFFRIGAGARRTRCWQEGRVMVIDDSFEHEVINTCDEERAVLQVFVDIWLNDSIGRRHEKKKRLTPLLFQRVGGGGASEAYNQSWSCRQANEVTPGRLQYVEKTLCRWSIKLHFYSIYLYKAWRQL